LFGIGPLEIAIVMVFALIFVGPQKLPGLAKQFGKLFVQLRRMTTDVRSTVDDYVREAEGELLKEEREKLQTLIQQEVLDPAKAITLDPEDSPGNSTEAPSQDRAPQNHSVQATQQDDHKVEQTQSSEKAPEKAQGVSFDE
jgi:Tat protein translocase TatB subunit